MSLQSTYVSFLGYKVMYVFLIHYVIYFVSLWKLVLLKTIYVLHPHKTVRLSATFGLRFIVLSYRTHQ